MLLTGLYNTVCITFVRALKTKIGINYNKLILKVFIDVLHNLTDNER